MTDLPAAAITAAGNAMRLKWQADYPGIIPFGLDPMDWATTALEAAAPHLTAAAAAAERERIRQRSERSPHRVETGGLYCQEDGFRWPCHTARWLDDLLREDTP